MLEEQNIEQSFICKKSYIPYGNLLLFIILWLQTIEKYKLVANLKM